MKIESALAMVMLTSYLVAQPTEHQLFGTHAFIDLGPEYTYTTDVGFSYLREDFSVAIFGTRVADSMSNLNSQFSVSGAKRELLPGSNRMIYLYDAGGGKPGSVQLFMLVGDDSESAVVAATVLQTNDIQGAIKTIKQAFETVQWKPDSDLGFSDALFYEPIETYELKPTAIIANRVNYTVDGTTFVNHKYSLGIGKNIMSSDYTKNPTLLVDGQVKMENGASKVLSITRSFLKVDELSGERVEVELEREGLIQKKLYAIFVEPKFVYFLIAESNDRNFDKYSDHFDTIVSNFRIKK